ncbi:MAG: hypothetical protein U0892_22475 [Pirellulales bacterium]
MRTMLAMSVAFLSVSASSVSAQDSAAGSGAQSTAAQVQPTSSTNAAPTVATGPQRIWIRDPRTGRVSQVEILPAQTTATQWQQRVVEQTVYTPQIVYETKQVPQTVYKAQTNYVMQPKTGPSLNPFAQPSIGYKQVPVTTWVPQTVYVTQQVPVQKLVPHQERLAIIEPMLGGAAVTVPAAAQSTQATNSSIASAPTTPSTTTPSSAPSTAAASSMAGAYTASLPPTYTVAGSLMPAAVNTPSYGQASRPVFGTVPILAKQQVFPPQPNYAPQSYAAAPSSGLRPITRLSAPAIWNGQTGYAAPLNVAVSSSAPWTREPGQAAMAPTVVR